MSYNANYPVSLDALANPSTTTNRNDPGFELHGVIGRLQDIAEALEAKVGIGAGGPPGGAAVLRRTATGASGWGQLATGDITAGAVSQFAVVTITPATGTASTTAVTLTGSSFGMTLTGGTLIMGIFGAVYNNTAGGSTLFQLFGPSGLGTLYYGTSALANAYVPIAVAQVVTASVGTVTLGVQWNVSTGSSFIQSAQVWAVELKK